MCAVAAAAAAATTALAVAPPAFVIEAIASVPLNSATPSLAILKFLEDILPSDKFIRVPSVEKSEPSPVPAWSPDFIIPDVIVPIFALRAESEFTLILFASILLVVIFPPSIVVLPLLITPAGS